jgi:hypothetical protein
MCTVSHFLADSSIFAVQLRQTMGSIDDKCTDFGALDNFCADARAQLEEVLLLREGELLATMEAVLKYSVLQQGRVVYQWREVRKKHQQENQKGQKEVARSKSQERSVDKERALSWIQKQAAVDKDQEKASSIESPYPKSGTTPGHSKRRLDEATPASCSPDAKRAREEEPRRAPVEASASVEAEDTTFQDSVLAISPELVEEESRRAPVEVSASGEEEDTIVQDSVLETIPEIADTKLEDLGNYALLNIASFLAGDLPNIASFLAGDLPRPQEAEEHATPLHTMMEANTARTLWEMFGALSKHFRERTCEILRPLLLVEADFYDMDYINYFSTIPR